MKHLTISAAVLLLISGCISLPPPAQMESQQLCNAFAHRDDGGLLLSPSSTMRKALYNEVMGRRGLISPDFKGAVIGHDVRIGMRQDEVLCSWGTPDKINRTATRGRESEQWVYPRGYIYFRDGHVYAMQD